jgi:hypothetical protein
MVVAGRGLFYAQWFGNADELSEPCLPAGVAAEIESEAALSRFAQSDCFLRSMERGVLLGSSLDGAVYFVDTRFGYTVAFEVDSANHEKSWGNYAADRFEWLNPTINWLSGIGAEEGDD